MVDWHAMLLQTKITEPLSLVALFSMVWGKRKRRLGLGNMSYYSLMLVSQGCLAKRKMLEKIENLGIVSCALTYLLELHFVWHF